MPNPALSKHQLLARDAKDFKAGAAQYAAAYACKASDIPIAENCNQLSFKIPEKRLKT